MKKLLIYMVAALLLGGCSADEPYDGQADSGLTPIRLSSGLEVQSRAHAGMDAELPAGRSVAFWVDNASTSAQIYGNNVLAADGSNGFTGGDAMYFPGGGGNVDIYAIHTDGTLTEAFPTSAITHTVAADQTAGADYYNSDLLYAVNRDVAKTTNAVPVTFYHMLSKVRIAIMPGTPETDLTGATVRIVGTKTAADFTPSKTADITQQTTRAAMVAASGTAADITVSNEVSADFTGANVKYNDAMVVPQTVAGGTAFISVTLANNTVLTWSPAAALTLESGKRYTYLVTVTRRELSVSTIVTDWENATENIELMGEANSYMVEPYGNAILIPIARANQATDSRYNLGADATWLGGVTADNYTVELVWGDTPVRTGGVIKKMEAKKVFGKGYIYVEPGMAGNAVICIKVGGVIKWSWHIWVTEPVTYATDTETGLTWMDRNLGAAGTAYDTNGQNGLYYQWGRKDAFPGSDGTDKIRMYYTQSFGDIAHNANPTGNYTELYDMVQNPQNFATNSSSYYGSLNVAEETNDSWGSISGKKTIYDPCPPGWKVPLSAWGSSGWRSGWGAFANNGRIFNGVNSTANLGHFYPITGRRNGAGEIEVNVINWGCYWSASTYSDCSIWMYINDQSALVDRYRTRVHAMAIRCVAE